MQKVVDSLFDFQPNPKVEEKAIPVKKAGKPKGTTKRKHTTTRMNASSPDSYSPPPFTPSSQSMVLYNENEHFIIPVDE